MLRPRHSSLRLPRLVRPLRPPSNHVCPPRYFTTNKQLLLISSTPPVRPQLPFLHTPSTGSPLPLRGGGGGGGSSSGNGNPLVLRALSTERRQKITQGIKVALTCYAIVLLLYVIQEGIYQRKIEQLFPTPPDWPFWARWDLRCARALQTPELWRRVATDWAKVAEYYRDLLNRVEGMGGEALRGGKSEDGGGEDDGAAAAAAADGGGGDAVVVPGVGEVGFGIENMSEAWKKGYFQALMGAAETAEKLDGWVMDTKSHSIAPAEFAVGPGNPNARPPPPGRTTRDMPQEENCVPAFDSPEVFYVKILTTRGFRTNQRLDAALAYADWLDFKGLTETAGAAYEWAMDIAVSGMPAESSSSDFTAAAAANPQQVVDQKTGILKSDVPPGRITDNLLRASTAMGFHQTRRGDLASALAIFLSVLRSRRDLPEPSPSSSSEPHPQAHTKQENQPSSDITSSLTSLFAGPPYPIPVRTGDEQALRTPSSACEEAGLMVYIGEIIYASSSPEHGLSWTRDAVDIAESTIIRLQQDEARHSDDTSLQRLHNPKEALSFGMQFYAPQERCQDCLKAGMGNWKTMVRELVVRAENEELEALDKVNKDSSTPPSWVPRLWSWWSRHGADEKRVQEKIQQRRQWEAEEMILKDRADTMSKVIGDQGVTAFPPGRTIVML